MAARESFSASDFTDSDDDGLTERISTPQTSQSKKKRYSQSFRSEWLADEELKEWLVRDKTGSAYCKWCNSNIQAKLSVLRSHAQSKKHKCLGEVSSGCNKVRDIRVCRLISLGTKLLNS